MNTHAIRPDSTEPTVLPDKVVIVLVDQIDAATAANTCALLATSIGAAYPGLVGPAVTDLDRGQHAGICMVPIPILRAGADTVAELARTEKDLHVVGFTRVAASCHNYDDYTHAMADTRRDELAYLGVALAGSRKQVNSLTGALPLLR